jgi:hypothetical protein
MFNETLQQEVGEQKSGLHATYYSIHITYNIAVASSIIPMLA